MLSGFGRLRAVSAGCAALFIFGSAASAQNLLVNPSFDDNGGSLDGWNVFGNASADLAISLSAPASAKLFGNFSGGFDVTGIFQAFPASDGLEFQMDCQAFVGDFDPVTGSGPPDFNWAVLKIAFFDAATAGNEIAASEVIIADGSSPLNEWTAHTVSGVAPAGTLRVEAFVLFLQPANDGGSVFVDDMSFQVLQGGATGACCNDATGVCTEDVTQEDCVASGGRYGGDNSTCGTLNPECGVCGVNLLSNGSFDANGGSLDGWNAFGNAFADTAIALSPPGSAKLFGNFSGGFDVSGIFQAFSAAEGMEFQMDCSSFVGDFDPITGDGPPDFNWAVMKISFFDSDAGGNEIGFNEVIIADGFSPLNVWQPYSVSGVAPAGTQRVEAFFLYLQPANDGGSAFVDDAAFRVVCPPEPEACCGSTGGCSEVLPMDCMSGGGTPLGLGSTCEGDADGDGVDAECGDGCPNDPGKTTPGICGCGTADVDSDSDSVLDCNDQCPGEDDTIDDDNNGTPDCLQDEAIPTVSTWGLVVLAIVLLIGAKLGFGYREASA